MKYFLLLICFITIQALQAQTIQFKVIDVHTWKGLGHVEIETSKQGKLVSNEDGTFQLRLINDDTIKLTKQNYHTLYFLMEAKNFDTSHVISISMASSQGETPSSDISTLQNFEYTFTKGASTNDNYFNIRIMESTKGAAFRSDVKPQEFVIGTTPLNHISIHGGGSPDQTYKLK